MTRCKRLHLLFGALLLLVSAPARAADVWTPNGCLTWRFTESAHTVDAKLIAYVILESRNGEGALALPRGMYSIINVALPTAFGVWFGSPVDTRRCYFDSDAVSVFAVVIATTGTSWVVGWIFRESDTSDIVVVRVGAG